MVQAYVVDTSILIQGFIEDDYTDYVLSLFDHVLSNTPVQLFIPEFSLVECTNILWKRIRHRGMTQEVAEKALFELSTFPLTVVEARPLLPRALRIGIEHNLAVYDSIYLVLCESMGHPILTADIRQSQAALKLGIKVVPITDFQ